MQRHQDEAQAHRLFEMSRPVSQPASLFKLVRPSLFLQLHVDLLMDMISW